MASSKRIGFYQGEGKISIVEFDKNTPQRVLSSSLVSPSNASSPFSSTLGEETQVTAILQKIVQDRKIKEGSFYLSLPLKEILLRSFIIPYVKQEDIRNAIKFESKKYVPFDIQELVFVYYAIPFAEEKSRRLQIIFFAVRKETLARYERIFKQVNLGIVYCEPYMVSLTKLLLFRKEIKATDHVAFLILDKTIGRICFIDKGIPQFIREFPIGAAPPPVAMPGDEPAADSDEDLNLKIINEVGNSFDFYARQFSGERIEQMLVSSELLHAELTKTLESELKIKIRSFSPVIRTGVEDQKFDMDAIYALGACVVPPIDILAEFNFLGDKKRAKTAQTSPLSTALKMYQESIVVFVICACCLGGMFYYFQSQLKGVQERYEQLSSQQGNFKTSAVETVQSDLQQNTDKLASLKNIRTKSDMAYILLRVASHLPPGALLRGLSVNYNQKDEDNKHVSIDLNGYVIAKGLDAQVAMVNQIFSDIKKDEKLKPFYNTVTLSGVNVQEVGGQKATAFNIHCS